jgi:hypothetical protein
MNELRSSKLKVERAKTHIDHLQIALKAYFGANPYGVRQEFDVNGEDVNWIIHSTAPLPDEVYAIVGDAIHNMRSSLDHLAVTLAKANGATKLGDVYFPFGRSREIFEASAKEKIKRLSTDARDMIRALQPYQGGNDFLFSLHALDNSDKHQTIIPVATRIGNMSGLMSFDRPARVSRNIFGNVEKGVLWLTVPLGTQVKYDFNIATDIAFTQVKAVEGQPVTATLEQFLNLVERILLAFEDRFFK